MTAQECRAAGGDTETSRLLACSPVTSASRQARKSGIDAGLFAEPAEHATVSVRLQALPYHRQRLLSRQPLTRDRRRGLGSGSHVLNIEEAGTACRLLRLLLSLRMTPSTSGSTTSRQARSSRGTLARTDPAARILSWPVRSPPTDGSRRAPPGRPAQAPAGSRPGS